MDEARDPDAHALGFWAQLQEDKRVNQNSLLQPGFQAMAVYRLGRWAREKKSRRPLLYVTKVLFVLIRNIYGIELYWTARVGRRFMIAHQGAIVIHRFCTIGDDCIIRQGATIGAADEWDRSLAPVIGNSVEIGAGAMIIGKVVIGDNVRIGPNAVVMVDIPSNSSVFAPKPRVISWG
jgi:serine O-acetyltransferase